jgi:hypothetical protein
VNTGSGYTEKVLSFNSPDLNQNGGLVLDGKGDLFGTTYVYAGPSGANSGVFELVNTGSGYSYTYPGNPPFYSFTDGEAPVGPLIVDANGDLFGTTSYDSPNGQGQSSVFELVNTGSGYTEKVLHSFTRGSTTNGLDCNGGLIADAKGDLFGTASNGFTNGSLSTGGAVFELVNTGSGYTEKVLHSFPEGGGTPSGPLIADAKGDLFGIGGGGVFELVNTSSGYTEQLLGVSGVNGPLIADAKGDLFATSTGGANGDGMVVEITNSGFVVSASPLVSPDFTHTTFGQQDIVPTPGVLANDQPITTGDTLTVRAVSVNGALTSVSGSAGTTVTGHYGSLQMFADGHYDYTASGASALPSSGVAEDFFGYTTFDQGQFGSGSASSTLTVVVAAHGLNVIGTGESGATIQGPNGHKPVLDGSAGNDTLIAGTGATVMVGGANDTLTAHKGYVDTCVFMGDFGNDTITNYNSVKDVIQLSSADFGTNPAAIAHDATRALGDPNTVITDPHNSADTITLVGVSLSSLHFDASHFPVGVALMAETARKPKRRRSVRNCLLSAFPRSPHVTQRRYRQQITSNSGGLIEDAF